MSRPAATTFGLPDTGAASTAVPRCSAASRTTCDAPGEIVVESTRTFGAAPSRDSRPASPSTTCWKSSSPAHHREDDVAVGEVGGSVDDGGAEVGQRFGLRARAVPHRDVVPGRQQATREREAHAAGTDPAQPHPVVLAHLASTGVQTIAGRYPGSFGASSAGRVGGRSRASLARVAWCRLRWARTVGAGVGAPRQAPLRPAEGQRSRDGAGGTGGRSSPLRRWRDAGGGPPGGHNPASRARPTRSAGGGHFRPRSTRPLAWGTGRRPRGPEPRAAGASPLLPLAAPSADRRAPAPGWRGTPARRLRPKLSTAQTPPTPLGSPQTIARHAGRRSTTDGDSHLRHDGRGLGGAHPLRPPARRAPRPHQGPARRRPSSARCCAST